MNVIKSILLGLIVVAPIIAGDQQVFEQAVRTFILIQEMRKEAPKGFRLLAAGTIDTESCAIYRHKKSSFSEESSNLECRVKMGSETLQPISVLKIILKQTDCSCKSCDTLQLKLADEKFLSISCPRNPTTVILSDQPHVLSCTAAQYISEADQVTLFSINNEESYESE